ncbi:hypothetical protein [Lactobacillus intestinalis]|uniref:hypothetical protein n=1 Tax=Lactobacillus intestinalis TaxID=151781 RepID=UPI001F594BCC|nr:hypothetical protein [Lactobacillus intestinalis]
MKKYLINDDDVICIGSTFYRITPVSPFLHSEKASKDYTAKLLLDGAECEIFNGGNDKKATPIMQGDIIARKRDSELAFILVSNQLIPLYEAKRALDAYSTTTNQTVISLPTPLPSPEVEQEFEKREKHMASSIKDLKALVENAEIEDVEIIDGVIYSPSHTWVEIARMALDLAEQQEWLERYEDKYCSD